jgi:hypothetical protein
MTTGLASGVANSILDSLAATCRLDIAGGVLRQAPHGRPWRFGNGERCREHDEGRGYMLGRVGRVDHQLG